MTLGAPVGYLLCHHDRQHKQCTQCSVCVSWSLHLLRQLQQGAAVQSKESQQGAAQATADELLAEQTGSRVHMSSCKWAKKHSVLEQG